MHLATVYIEDSMRARVKVKAQHTHLMVLAPGVGFEPTWPEGPQAFKLLSRLKLRLTSGFAPYLVPRIQGFQYALGDPGTAKLEISGHAVLRLFGEKHPVTASS